MDIDDELEKLDKNPLFHFFIASKELFHSNFWYWLSKKNKNELYKVFSGRYHSSNMLYFIREEKKNRNNKKARVDLIIKDENKPLMVIENKVKDIAKKEQLDLIQYVYNSNAIDYVLVTLHKNEKTLNEDWKILTYNDLYSRIDPEKYTENKFEQKLIESYKDLIFNLDLLIQKFDIDDKYKFFISNNIDMYKKLNEHKLWEMYQKIQGSNMYNFFREKLSDEILIGYGVNNQKLTFDVRKQMDEKCSMGIQIEDNQYRRLIEIDNADRSIKKLLQKDLFFSSAWKSTRNHKYLNYGKKFKYQYEKIESIEFVKLLKKIEGDLNYLKNNKNIIINSI